MTIYIYGLIDPFTNDVRYIGKSIRPDGRLRDHCNDRSSCHRTHWIQSVLAKGDKPRLVILEGLADNADWQAIERKWITYAREAYWPITNSTDGGDGVVNLCADAKAKMVKTWTGRKHRPESLIRIGRASKGRKKSEASKQIMREKMKGRQITWADKVSMAVRKLTDEDVHTIRKSLQSGVKIKDLAQMYGVHRTTITNIKMGRFYADVEV